MKDGDFFKLFQQFAPLTDLLKKDIYQKTKIMTINKKDYLIHSGENNQKGYFVIEGCLMHLHLNEEGEHSVLSFAEDQVYPYICSPSFFSRLPEDSEIQALEDCTVLEVRREDLESWAWEIPDFGRYYQSLLSRGLHHQYRYSAMRISLHSKDFLLALQRDFPQWMERIPHKYLAQFMGISQEWFSKLLKEQK
jgi:CRP-like cAMP-binding protein